MSGSPETMKRLVLAAVLHVAATNNCERATDLKPEHFCAKPTNPDALRGAIPDSADALPLHGERTTVLERNHRAASRNRRRGSCARPILKARRWSGCWTITWALATRWMLT